ncbi:MAG TPA: glycosyltransferase family 39 protein [Pseudolabrys sp.]|nr:glycosyltransferase family 39 protein [Pseudolabrys sp.]
MSVRTEAGTSVWRARLAALDRYDVASALLLLALVVIALATLGDYAISNDEEVQQRYGELILAYYRSGFTDQTVFNFKNLYLYGGLFDVVATLLGKFLPFDLYTIRHGLCALIGVGGIAATCATARLLAGPRAGALAVALIAVCGAWYGGMFNHTKDIPFGAAMMAATYFLLRCARDLPQPRWRDVLLLGLTIGAALGQRVTGLLVIGYVLLIVMLGAAATQRRDIRSFTDYIGRSAIRFAPGFVLAYLVMIVAWPWAARAPLNPIAALFDFAEFHYPIRTVLSGHVYLMGDVPRWYVPTYLAIKLPLLTLLGALVATAWAIGHRHASGTMAQTRNAILFIAFTIGFPLLCQVALRGPAFTGMRHFLFVVPPLTVLAAIGLETALRSTSARSFALGTGLAASLTLILLWNASQLVRLHPYEYVFFNPLVGGIEGADRRYDTDYWVNIMPEAVGDLEAYVAPLEAHRLHGHRFTVAVCGERLPFEKEADAGLSWTPDWDHADFFIAPTHMNCDRALDGKIIATIARAGAVIGVVKDRRALLPSTIAVSN